MATLLRSEYDLIRTRQSLDDFRRLLSLLSEDESIFIAEDEEDVASEIGEGGFVVGPTFSTAETRPGGEPDEQVASNETEEQHLVSVEPSSPFVSPATEAERVAAEAAAAELAEAEDAAVSPDAEPESELSEDEAQAEPEAAGEVEAGGDAEQN